MSAIEDGKLHIPHRERVVKTAIATLVVSVPVTGLLLRREMSIRKEKVRAEKKQEAQQEAVRQEAILIYRDSVNSGNSGFDFD